LADQVEQLMLAELRLGRTGDAQLRAAAFAAFPGWQTPDEELLTACLTSYAELQGERWNLRREDHAGQRSRDMGEIALRLAGMGRALGYDVWVSPLLAESIQGLAPVGRGGPSDPDLWTPAGIVWHEQDDPVYAFAVTDQALVHPWLMEASETFESKPRFVVLPGGRAGLLDFKLERCPAWRERLAWIGWDFVKYRHIRRLAAMPDLTLASFRARIGLDPVVTLPGQQLALFDGDL
jgi:hypothetical protein